MEIGSGDRVTIHTISGGPDVTPGPDSGFTVPPELVAVQREVPRPTVGGGHILTGPIAVRGARPGDVLEVRILDVKPRMDWGYNIIRPLAGALPHDFTETTLVHIGIDRSDEHTSELQSLMRISAADFCLKKKKTET